MRVLVTRPMADAVPFAKQLQAAGHEAVIEPMIRIRPMAVPASEMMAALEGVSGLLFTSANGVRAFGDRSKRRDIRAWCVGEGSAEAARQAGFSDVETAGGDVDLLAAHVAARGRPEDGPLLHSAGSHRAGNLPALLTGSGFGVRRLVLYEAVPRGALTDQTTDALNTGAIDIVTLFSPRTARLFAGLVRVAGLEPAMAGITTVSLSQAVCDALDLTVKNRLVAEHRHQNAMLEHFIA